MILSEAQGSRRICGSSGAEKANTGPSTAPRFGRDDNSPRQASNLAMTSGALRVNETRTNGMQAPGYFASSQLYLKLYFAVLAVATVVLGAMDFHVKNGWILGDWLINYRGGFVRRGLAGEVALRLAHLLHLSPGAVVLPVLLGLYGTLFYVVWRLLAGSNFNLWLVLFLLSPATLAFPLYDPPEAFHKEELHFAGLGVLLLLLIAPRVKDFWLVVYLSVVTTVTILSHEGLAFFTPYYFGALVIGLGFKRALRVAAVPAVLSVVAAAVAAHHPGNLAAAEQICSSLGATIQGANIGICGGAILFLQNNAGFSRQLVLDFIHDYGYWSIYPQLVVLAAVPIVLAHRALWKYASCRRHLKTLYATMAVSLVATVPLFIYATAWGRWLYVHALSIFLLLLLIDRKRQLDPETSEAFPVYLTQWRTSFASLGWIAAYALLWDIPGEGFYPARFGIFGLLHYAMHYRLPHGP
jgi:hypothetical protein